MITIWPFHTRELHLEVVPCRALVGGSRYKRDQLASKWPGVIQILMRPEGLSWIALLLDDRTPKHISPCGNVLQAHICDMFCAHHQFAFLAVQQRTTRDQVVLSYSNFGDILSSKGRGSPAES